MQILTPSPATRDLRSFINLLEDNIELVLLKWNAERTRVYQK